jgi:hypothetical protein
VFFVWGAWAALALAGVWFVYTFGSEVPWADDWPFHVSQVSGAQAVTGRWLLLDRYGEYPTPSSKLLLVALCRLVGFHGELYVNVVALAVLAAALVLAARRLRGTTRYADAFFPLALLHFGSDCFIWESQLCNYVPMLLASTLLIVALRWGVGPPPAGGVLAGLTLLGMALSGPAGLAYVPAMALWLLAVAAGLWNRRRAGGRAAALVVVCLAAAALVYTGYCMLESRKPLPGQFREHGTLTPTLVTAVQLASMTLGNVIPYWRVTGLVVLGLVGGSFAALALAWLRRPAQRGRVFGMVLFLGSAALLVLGMARARSAFPDPKGLQAHYVPHVISLLLGAYFVLGAYGARLVRRLVPVGLMLLLAAMLPLNTRAGLAMGHRIDNGCKAFAADLLAGKPPEVLAERHSRFQFDVEAENYPLFEAMFADQLRDLRRAGMGLFGRLNDPGDFREAGWPIDPVEVHGATWEHGTLRTSGADSFLGFALDEPTFVCGVRLKYSYRDPDSTEPSLPSASFRATWKREGQLWDAAERTDRIALDPDFQTWGPTWRGEGTLTVWVNDTIDRFHIFPDDKPRAFRLTEMTLLLPMADYHPGTRIDFGRPGAGDYLGNGWYDADEGGRWSGPRAAVGFRLARAEPLRLRLGALAFGRQRVVATLNGQELARWELHGEAPQELEVSMPAALLRATNTLVFEMPDARSPQAVFGSEDDRTLGMSVAWLELAPG